MDEYFDCTSGEVDVELDDHTLMDHSGNLLGRVDDHWALDYSTGKMHFVDHIGSDDFDDEGHDDDF